MNFFIKYISEFWNLTVEMAPWLLLGFLVAGLLKAYFPAQKIDKYLGKNNLASVLKAAFLGVPMPLCSCGVIPTGVGFYKSGASAGATSAFLISTPQTGIDSIFATQALMGWPLAIIRPFIAFTTGIFGGVLTNMFKLKNPNKFVKKQLEVKHPEKCATETADYGKKNKLKIVFYFAFVKMVKDLAKWLLIGIALAALISVWIPDTFFEQYIGSGFMEIFAVLVLSIPLYICATGSIPVASSLILKGLSPGAAIVFLMAGPATNIATLTVLKKAIGAKFMWLYLFSIVLGAVFFGFLINMLVPYDFFVQYVSNAIQGTGTNMIYTISGAILLGLIFYALFLDPLFNKKIVVTSSMKIIKVEGMNCGHCKGEIEKNISSEKGVTKVLADLQTQEVFVEGNFDTKHIKQQINKLGYKVIK